MHGLFITRAFVSQSVLRRHEHLIYLSTGGPLGYEARLIRMRLWTDRCVQRSFKKVKQIQSSLHSMYLNFCLLCLLF